MIGMQETRQTHWLDQYAGDCFQWQQAWKDGRAIFYRPLGLVEFAFDTDGRYFEGRADINTQLDVCIRTKLNSIELRERLLLAWANLRCYHVLLQAKALKQQRYMRRYPQVTSDSYFVVELPNDVEESLQDAQRSLLFLEDHYENVDPNEFWRHCQNTARLIEPERALATLFVLPVGTRADGSTLLRFLKVASHQITEGLTNYAWMNHFLQLLNEPSETLRSALPQLVKPETLSKRLPMPQEALYPPIIGSRARQRWFWLLTRILRHVRKPLPAAFSNPLRRSTPLASQCLTPTYDSILDYSTKPPLNSFPCFCYVPMKYSQHLHRLCRQANASIGAGCFALVAIVMMEMHELREPNVSLAERRAFGAGFPLNPRPFFNHEEPPDSLMLAFCDGIILPFLSADLDFDGRIRLLARQAHKQLAAYQKRKRPTSEEAGIQYMGGRGAGRMLANQYISSIERADSLLPLHLRRGVKPQGAYPMQPNATPQTCGVSSVGRKDAFIKSGVFDLCDESKDFVADYLGDGMSVRVREGEFLVGIGGSEEGLWACVSVDENTHDPFLVAEWKRRLESILVDHEKATNTARL